MGLLSDFFAASPAEAATVDPDNWIERASDFEVLASGRIEPTVMLGMLEHVLLGTPFEETLSADIRLGAGGESWVYELRQPLQDALDDERADWRDVAERWLATGELGYTDADALTAFLEEMSAFARRATASGKRLYCWGSL